mmetsp:Transcript_13409/g.48795  ORF Transcript_13409/g.48795 Transcript_13409/m.48795 type:complete len:222 (+) Transcript_13409:855-1520(+)
MPLVSMLRSVDPKLTTPCSSSGPANVRPSFPKLNNIKLYITSWTALERSLSFTSLILLYSTTSVLSLPGPSSSLLAASRPSCSSTAPSKRWGCCSLINCRYWPVGDLLSIVCFESIPDVSGSPGSAALHRTTARCPRTPRAWWSRLGVLPRHKLFLTRCCGDAKRVRLLFLTRSATRVPAKLAQEDLAADSILWKYRRVPQNRVTGKSWSTTSTADFFFGA